MNQFFVIRPLIYSINKILISILACGVISYISYFEFWNPTTIKYISILSLCILISFFSSIILTYENKTFELKKGLRIFKTNISFIKVANVKNANQVLIKRYKINFNNGRLQPPTEEFHYIFRAYLKYPNRDSIMIGTSRNKDEYLDELKRFATITNLPMKLVE